MQTNQIRLMPIDKVRGADYNPRTRVPERFEKLIASLRHLGFVLPLYVNKDGLLLSGHQRTAAAKELGYTMVPVVDIDIDPSDEKGLNLYFNRATNDFDGIETSKDLFDKFVELEEHIDFSKLAVIEPDTVYPCMGAKEADIGPLFSAIEPPSSTTVVGAQTLMKKGIYMPVVVSGGRVLNGAPRVYGYQLSGWKTCQVVEVPEGVADYAQWVLNGISMDFNLQEAFADELRYNAFRRLSVQAQMVGFSRTYSFFPFGKTMAASRGMALSDESVSRELALLPHQDPETRKKYLSTYGETVIDFGAGTLHDANLLRKAGFNVLAFEPYQYPEGETKVSPQHSREQNSKFLDQLDALLSVDGQRSIISSYVMNSIPHHKDRMAYLTILSAMASPRTTVFLGTQHIAVRKGSMKDKINPNMEPNMTLGDSVAAFKVQKYFYEDELEKMLKVFWVKVTMKVEKKTIYCRCEYPRKPNASLLREALELEFNLPYADGTSMGLVDKAKEIFGRYHKMNLT